MKMDIRPNWKTGNSLNVEIPPKKKAAAAL